MIDPSPQGIIKIFILLFENNTNTTVCTKYYLQTAEIKKYNVMIDEQKFFDQSVKNNLITYDNIVQKIVTCQGDDFIIGCIFG